MHLQETVFKLVDSEAGKKSECLRLRIHWFKNEPNSLSECGSNSIQTFNKDILIQVSKRIKFNGLGQCYDNHMQCLWGLQRQLT